jgi:hypothetical protein
MRVFLEDCSANGTYINDLSTKVSKGQRIELRSSDEIYLINPKNIQPDDLHTHMCVFTFINLRDRLFQNRNIVDVEDNKPMTLSMISPLAPNQLFPSPILQQQPNQPQLHHHQPQQQQFLQVSIKSPKPPSTSSSQILQPPQRRIEDEYIIGDQIGSGMSGQVYICIQKRSNRKCAVKVIDIRKFNLTPGLTKEDLLSEAKIMQELKHVCYDYYLFCLFVFFPFLNLICV